MRVLFAGTPPPVPPASSGTMYCRAHAAEAIMSAKLKYSKILRENFRESLNRKYDKMMKNEPATERALPMSIKVCNRALFAVSALPPPPLSPPGEEEEEEEDKEGTICGSASTLHLSSTESMVSSPRRAQKVFYEF